ncbi:thermostable beta-glucosidase B [Mycena maculata]|uniref:beta-glucosidase n=1 Tax=Mycena maculata TaxID=230809 RepID=A0AAD7IXT2_9AGAR|nr:thermostable beta-glucosidase B [Mycena maculata]
MSPDGMFLVTFSIKNTSKVVGREVAQVYISDLQSLLPRPVKELKGFVKVVLQGGETKSVKIDLNHEALSFYNDGQMSWVAEKGKFEILLAASSEDIRLKNKTESSSTITWTRL